MEADESPERVSEAATDTAADEATAAQASAESDAPTTEPGFSAGYLDNPPPAYPRASQRLREEGEVRLRVVVDREGKPVTWSVVQSSGHERLDRAAKEAVAKWRFDPATRGGEPVRGEVIVPLQFTLR
ncbi:energy transducer TonB [Guyparkeria sp. SB14A]|nr:energy transducer TonB [Guyparkeria sp. SB14A]